MSALINPMAGVGIAPTTETKPVAPIQSPINPMVHIPTAAEMSPRERRETFTVVEK